jgi:uncharacterized protein (TIGR01777 family)
MAGDRIVLCGGSGFLGTWLARALVARGDSVTILTRSPPPDASRFVAGVTYVSWDGKTPGEWARTLDGARAVVNLAGRSVNCRYTDENRREIVDSRICSVRAVADAVRRAKRPPEVLVQAASLAIYGDPADAVCDEGAPAGDGFSVETCVAWEKTFDEEPTPATRRVLFRIGFVLGPDGGALGTLANLTRWGLGGRVGSGRQFISWLHVHDMNRMFLWAIDGRASGTYNATGPEPVDNARFMAALRKVLHRRIGPPTPSWAVHVGAFFMGTEPSLALGGRRCVPKRLLEEGFSFDYPELAPALADIFPSRA